MSRAARWSRVTLAVAGLGLWSGAAMAKTFDVTITNLTKGQIISAPVVAAHDPGIAIFQVGSAASDQLAALAEDAAADDLIALLESVGAEVEQAGTGIPPGGQVTVRIEASGLNRVISAVGMLVTTNDAFFGLDSVRPRGRSTAYRVPAYDAGSEANNENCAFIPGPPCGNGGVRDSVDAEGFVHIHNGVHGIAESQGGLVPSRDDWRNPVAQITVTRVSGDDDDD